jgi:hypothetical protein
MIMDMTDKEFHRVFLRLTRRISFKGCKNPTDVNRRLLRKDKKKRYSSRGDPLDVFRAPQGSGNLSRLVPYFGERVIAEAHANPAGMVAQYLQYTREKAERKWKQLKEWRLDRKYKRKWR